MYTIVSLRSMNKQVPLCAFQMALLVFYWTVIHFPASWCDWSRNKRKRTVKSQNRPIHTEMNKTRLLLPNRSGKLYISARTSPLVRCVVEKADFNQWAGANRQRWQPPIGQHGLTGQSGARGGMSWTNSSRHRAQPAENGDMSPSLPRRLLHQAPLHVDLHT